MASDLRLELDELLGERAAPRASELTSSFEAALSRVGRAVVLVGAGRMGRTLLRSLRTRDVHVVAFADDWHRLWDQSIEGVPVLPMRDATEKHGRSALFVIAVLRPGHNFRATKARLTGFGAANVISAPVAFLSDPKALLPHFFFDDPSRTISAREKIFETFEAWADDESRREFVSQVRLRLSFDTEQLSPPLAREPYFPDDLFTLKPGASFVDCGAYDGDSMRAFLRRLGGTFGTITAIEPDPINYHRLQEFTYALPARIRERITIVPKAVSGHDGRAKFEATGSAWGAITARGTLDVECLRLDTLLGSGSRQYLKIDVEGSEVDALRGAENLLIKSDTTFAVSAYHSAQHLWEIPAHIRSVAPRRRLYLRSEAHYDGLGLICYALAA